MKQVENLLSEASLEALRSLKGKTLVAIFTTRLKLESPAFVSFVARTEAGDVIAELHDEGFRHPLVYDPLTNSYDITLMTVRHCTRSETEGRIGDFIYPDKTRAPLHRRAHRIGKRIERVVVLLENFWANDPRENPDDPVDLPEEDWVYVREPRAIALVLEDETLLFDKGGLGWGTIWDITRTPGKELRLPEDFTEYEAIDL